MRRTRETLLQVLLVEDNEADAELTQEYLATDERRSHRLHRVRRFQDALAFLRVTPVDVVLLDLFVPDGLTSAGVGALQDLAGDAPVIILTGLGNDDLVFECLSAGAQDFLSKDELDASTLARTIERSLLRQKTGAVRTMQHCLAGDRRDADAARAGPLGATVEGSPTLCERGPAEFHAFVVAYRAMLGARADADERRGALGQRMEELAASFADMGGGPCDLMEVHAAALSTLPQDGLTLDHRPLVREARLFALEMMGLLAEHYRRAAASAHCDRLPA